MIKGLKKILKKYVFGERRDYKRLTVSIPLKIESESSGEVFEAVSKDISLKGLAFLANRDLSEGELFTMTFSLPNQKEDLRILGQIIWKSKVGEDLLYGSCFLHLVGESRKKLLDYFNKTKKELGKLKWEYDYID